MGIKFLRIGLILVIVYVSVAGGVSEHLPIIRIAHQTGLALLLAGWLINLLWTRRPFPRTPLDYPLLLVGGAWLVSVLFSHDLRVSLAYFWPICTRILAFYALVDIARRLPLRWFMEGLMIFGAALVIFSAVEFVAWYWGLSILPKFVQSWPAVGAGVIPPYVHNLSLLLNYNNPEAAYCLLLIPVVFAWSNTARQRDFRWALRAILAGLVVTLILTQSRGGYLGGLAAVGILTLAGLVRPETRSRLPAVLRPLLEPRRLIAATVLGLAVYAAGILWITVNATGSDVARKDLWTSALQMFRDHPITGVGLRQFAAVRLWYPNSDASPSYLPLQHAHDLYLHLLAEGGLVVVAALLGLVGAFGRVWWQTWTQADARLRRRLEGILAALVGFAIHNLVDSFIATQLIVPVLILVAYVVTRHSPDAPARRVAWRQQRLTGVALALVIGVQIAFIPWQQASLLHERALSLLVTERPVQALAEERRAIRLDPRMDLYRLQEADILGRLADRFPENYLDDAIIAYEDSLDRNPAWGMGWHDLGALYAQAGRYEEAIAAGQQAVHWDPRQGGYSFQLAQYYEAAGHLEEAYQAYFDALKVQPALASSEYWTDPAAPERAQVLPAAIAYFSDQPDVAFDIAVYAGDLDTAARLAQQNQEIWTGDLWTTSGRTCLYCFDISRREYNPRIRQYLMKAERLLSDGDPANDEARRAAQTALFVGEGRASWGWYQVVRAQGDSLAVSTLENDLARAVPFMPDYRGSFPTRVYGTDAMLSILPQARTPILARMALDPWVALARHYEDAGNWTEARDWYEAVLEFDPYYRSVHERQAMLASK